MISHFPAKIIDCTLNTADFIRFEQYYRNIIVDAIPTATGCMFFGLPIKTAIPSQIQQGIDYCLHENKAIGVHGDGIFIVFSCENGQIACCVTGVDLLVLQKASESWLEDVVVAMEARMLQVKERLVDSETGFLNLFSLNQTLRNDRGERYENSDVTVFPDTTAASRGANTLLYLIEVPQPRIGSRYIYSHLQAVTDALSTFTQNPKHLYYLGNALFALYVESGGVALGLAEKLVAFLRREGFRRVHVGVGNYHHQRMHTTDVTSGLVNSGLESKPPLINHSSVIAGSEEEHTGLLDQAWTALQEAVKRGPYSFCSYSSLLAPEQHPLSAPSKTLKLRIARAVQSIEKYSLALLSLDKSGCLSESQKNHNANNLSTWNGCDDCYCCNSNGSDFSTCIQKLLDEFLGDKLITSNLETRKKSTENCFGIHAAKAFNWNGDCLLLLPELVGEDARKQVTQIVESVGLKNCVLSAGISSYPFKTTKKSDTIIQARKALLHTRFYGEGTVTEFDSVSCNVSGDIYYSEGNFTQAVQEYKLGLVYDETDVNLLNSLGVTYAMMGRSENVDCFEKVLSVEENNLMALYNLGQSYLATEDMTLAANYLEKAFVVATKQVEESGDGEKEQKTSQDIRLQLGVLSSKIGRARQAVELLTPLTGDVKFSCKHNILFYLGSSHFTLGENRRAIRYLQQGVAAKCLEDQTLSLLGYLYYLEGQGVDVALSLCRKAVSLNPVDLELQLRLAEILIAAQRYDEAMPILEMSMRKKPYQQQAKKLKGLIKKSMKKSSRKGK